jgi:hypothetical protein
VTAALAPQRHAAASATRIYEPTGKPCMSGMRIVGAPANDHDSPRTSRQIIRPAHAETQVEGGVSAA